MLRHLSLCLTLLLCCCQFALADNEKRIHNWIEVRTPNFTVLSDGSVERARAIGEELECLRETLKDETVDGNDEPARPLVVIAFRRSSDMAKVAPLYQGKAVRLDGLYQAGERHHYIAVDTSAQVLRHAVAHEYTHYRLNARNLAYPVWLAEGLSEYLATAVTGEAKPRQQVAFGSQLVLEQLLSLREDSREYNEEDFHRAFYADASLLAEYFWTNNEQKQRLYTFLQLSRTGIATQDAIKEAFGTSSEEMSRALRSFAAQPKVPGHLTPSCSTEAHVEAHPISDLDARAQLADFKAQVAGRLADSIRDFEGILRENPNHPIALRGLAYALWQKGDTARAGRYFHLAAIANPHDHLLPYLDAFMLRLQGADTNVVLRREMQAALSSSIALNPTFADAHHWLSLTYAWDKDFEAAAQEARKAMELDPTNDEFKFNLAALYAHAHHLREARSLCDELKTTTNKDVASRAESLSLRLQDAD